MKKKAMLFAAAVVAAALAGCKNPSAEPARLETAAVRAEGGELRISVFAKFIRQTAAERNIPLAEAADLLYDLGVRGFDCGPDETDLDALCATKLKPINFYYFPNWFGRGAWVDKTPPAECLKLAKKLGIPRIMVVPPDFTEGGDEEAEFKEILARLKAYVADAKAMGVTITVEDFGGTANPGSSIKYLKRFLAEIPDLRFALDTGNLYYAGRGESIFEMLEHAKGRIAHVHLKDQKPEANRTYETLGLGAVPNEAIVKRVNAAGYDGWYTLENPVGDTYTDTVRQVAVLKSWLNGK
ncbi:MAG: sugar phosphate isomerase/epimerase [Kiritimatiellae bacterium]|nr:sugar phosphate isomerase/epimerase [Kiritimatiellia bacterium]